SDPCCPEPPQEPDVFPPSSTPPTPADKLLQMLPNILTRSQESQLANRLEGPETPRSVKKNKLLQVNGCRNAAEAPAPRSPLPSVPATPTLDVCRCVSADALVSSADACRSSPQTPRRDIGLAVTHRFSTKSWLSQTCQVCRRSLMFGVKCKLLQLKCHNKCTKDAPSCRISFLTFPRMRRAESVPSDINHRIEQTAGITRQFGTLPKMENGRPAPPLDSSSNASSATSSAPSSPAPLQQGGPPSTSPPPPNDCFRFPGTPPTHPHTHTHTWRRSLPLRPSAAWRSETRMSWRSCPPPISRKVSQTSVYLQEWDIPYEQLQLGELIGKGRWGKVHKGRWHGEVAIRLLEVAGDQQEHLKLFKKEVMNYRQTRHDNVILFMGACMVPPHLAIVTSFCRGATLYSMVRERAATLDLNRTRQIARDIVNGMSYLHAKGIVHKDLKSKNVFYHTNKVVITDFGLFGMSGLVQQGRKKTVLRIPHGWIYYLAPEIVKQMGPEVDEDQLPFSKAADVYAFGTVWYELHSGGWPLASQPVEAKIWLLGSGEGVRKELADANLGKEITEIVSTCWSPEASARPTFSQLAGMLERLPKLNRRLSHPGHF
uniref:Kinase suppressor of ras 1 n=1 Tax=Tetraodon nigroviridis TaxID=99883 RepID=H3BYQ0_TETNG